MKNPLLGRAAAKKLRTLAFPFALLVSLIGAVTVMPTPVVDTGVLAAGFGGPSWGGSAPAFNGGTITGAGLSINPSVAGSVPFNIRTSNTNGGVNDRYFSIGGVGSEILGLYTASSTGGQRLRLGGAGIDLEAVTTDITTGPNEDLTLLANGLGNLSLQGQTVVMRAPLVSGTSSATNAGSGSCTSVTVSGTSLDFAITATCTAAQTVVVTVTNFGGQPRCTISSANSAAGAVTTGTPYESAGSGTSATFTFPAVTAGTYNVICAL